MSNNGQLMSQTEFAEFYGVSQPMVARYIQQGKIPKSCIVKDGRYKKIKVQCAVDELERNLDPIKRKPRKTEPDQNINEFLESGPDVNDFLEPDPLALLEEYEEFIRFDVNDPDEFGGVLAMSLDTLSIISASLNNEAQNRLERNLEDIADMFGCRRVNVEGLTGKRCLPVGVK